jgi:hypothetical protein
MQVVLVAVFMLQELLVLAVQVVVSLVVALLLVMDMQEMQIKAQVVVVAHLQITAVQAVLV